MAQANYTEQMTSKMVATYTANPTRETVDALAKRIRQEHKKCYRQALKRRACTKHNQEQLKLVSQSYAKQNSYKLSNTLRHRASFPSESQQG